MSPKPGEPTVSPGVPDEARRETDTDTTAPAGSSRREFLKSSAGALGAAAAALGSQTQVGPVLAQSRRILLKDGIVLSLDPRVGDFEKADVLIEGKKILQVGPNLNAAGAERVDCDGLIVMPGFVTTHHHQFYTLQRSVIPDSLIVFAGNPGQQVNAWPYEAYGTVAGQIWTQGRIPDPTSPGKFLWDLGRPPYDPEDNYLSELVACLSEITQGVTCGTDTSQANHSPAYTDALIQGLIDSGRRTVFDYGGGTDRGQAEFPGAMGDTTKGIGRIAKKVLQLEGPIGDAGVRGRRWAGVSGRALYGLAAWPLVRCVRQQPRRRQPDEHRQRGG